MSLTDPPTTQLVAMLRLAANRLIEYDVELRDALGDVAYWKDKAETWRKDHEHIQTVARGDGRSDGGDKEIILSPERILAMLDVIEAAEKTNLQLPHILHEMAGAVSLCWEPRPHGVFDSSKAIEFISAAIDEIRAPVDAARKRLEEM